jgi:hypothetical protein
VIDDQVRNEVRRSVVERSPIDEREQASLAAFLSAFDALAEPFSEDADIVHVTGSAIVVGGRGVVLQACEETGLALQLAGGDAPPLLHVDVHPGPRGHTHLDLRYVITGDDGDPAPPPEESQECFWFAWPDALAMAEPGLIGALRTYLHQQPEGPSGDGTSQRLV